MMKSVCYLAYPCATALVALWTSTGALAQSFVVQNGQTVGQQVMNDPNDSGVVEPGGAVETTNSNEHGVVMGDAAADTNQTLDVGGTIHTEGDGARGIQSLGDDAGIDVSGTIHTEGNDADGIYSQGDDAEIDVSGTIKTEGDRAAGIRSEGGNAKIDVSGKIHTEGDYAYGIYNFYSDYSPVTNSGTIHTEGDHALGIYNTYSDYSPLTNTGSVHTEGDYASGIYNEFSHDSPVTNSGMVHTEGFSHGIRNSYSDKSPISNSGTVHTEGDSASGLFNYFSVGSPISNSGTVHTEGDEADGITNGYSDDSPVTNSGKVRTSGADAVGIRNYYSDTSPVTNSGYVVSALSDSFQFNDITDSPLTLKAPSYIGGAINFITEETLNIQTGPSHSVLWQLPANMAGGAPNVSGSVPWFYNAGTMQFATYDPSVFAGEQDMLSDLTRQLSQVARSHLGRSTYTNGYGADLAPLEAVHVAPAPTSSWWLAGFGGDLTHDGDSMALDRDIEQVGVALGYNWQAMPGLELGLMGGYVHGDLSAASRFTTSYNSDADTWFAGFNGRQQWGGAWIDFGLTGGYSHFDQSRFVNDNLALTNGLTLGQSWADSTTSGWFVSPEVVIGMDFNAGNWVFTPSAGVRYAAQWLDGYSESGSGANATVADRHVGLVEGWAEIEATKVTPFGSFAGRLGYLARASVGDEAVSVAMIGDTHKVGFGDTDADAAYAGLTANFDIGGNAQLQFDGEYQFGGDVEGYTGMVKFAASF